MAIDAHNRVVMLGGSIASNGTSVNADDSWLWNGLWQQAAITSPGLTQAAMAFDAATGETIAFGGLDDSNVPSNVTWAWDGTNWSQKATNNHPSARYDLAMAYDPNTQRIILFGGNTGVGGNAETWIWNGTDWTQVMPLTSPSLRLGSRMVYDATHNQILMFGGMSGMTLLNETWTFNMSTLNWTQLSPAQSPGARDDFGMAYSPARQGVVLVGGTGAGGFLSDIWDWNGTTWHQALPTGSSPSARYYSNIAYDPFTAGIILFGGIPQTGPFSNETWILIGDTWTLFPIQSTPDARQASAMAYDGAHQNTVLYGGTDLNAVTTQDTWTYDGTTWLMKNPAQNPGPRSFAQAAFDPGHNVVVLWGGFDDNGIASRDTWLWNGTNWTQVVTANSPPGRIRFGMAYDNVSKTVMIFGGDSFPTPGVLNDTWEFNGTNWNQISPSTSPSARGGGGIASDTVRNRIVLFGGHDANGHDFTDTWEWDGVNWTNVTPANSASSPPGNDRYGIAYDSTRRQTIITAGEHYTVPSSYAWNGSVWTALTLVNEVPPRTDFAMTYDTHRRQSVLFGGFRNSLIFGDTWTLPAVVSDFDGNGATDLIWQNDSTFQVALWLMGGPQDTQFQNFLWIDPNGQPGWSVATIADLNQDGVPDIIWQNTNGEAVVWYMGGYKGAQFENWAWLQSSPLANWKIVGAADLNGDGINDLIWQNTSNGEAAVWYMTGAGGNQFGSFAFLPTPPSGWNAAGLADFNQDGHPDVVWQNASTRQAVVWYMGGPQGNQMLNWAWIQQSLSTPTWKIVGFADINGDGITDVIWQEDNSRAVLVWYMGGLMGNLNPAAAFLSGNTAGWRAVVAH